MKRGMIRGGAIALIAVAGIGGFLASRHFPGDSAGSVQVPAPIRPQAQDMIGRMRPDFSLADVDGVVREIGEWDGKVLALNFWATWCPPCRHEIPEFVELQQKYGDRGLQFVGIALERAEDVRPFMEMHHMNYPVLAGEMEVIRIAESYGNHIGALPYTVIIDRAGRIVFVKPGPLPGPAAEQVIAPLL
jgi:peroxiredoxin